MDPLPKVIEHCHKCGREIDFAHDLFESDWQWGQKYYAHIRYEDPKGDGSAPEGGEERFPYG